MAEQRHEQTSAKRLLIIDGHAYAYRAFYAIRQLSSSVTGEPTNAIYGFIRMLGKIRAFLQPTHLIVVWDGGLCEKRMSLHPDYKIHRPSTPPLLEAQIPEIARFLSCARIASYCREGIEADDWIASLAKRAAREGFAVVLASSDKDFFQLVDSSIGLLNPNDKEPKVWTAADVIVKTGVDPTQVVDWLSLIGDTVDNIEGVPGVGPNTATRLLKEFGSIKEVYNRIDEVKPLRVQTALRASEGLLARNQQLIQLNCDLPDVPCCDELKVAPSDDHGLLECYTRWGFKTLSQEIGAKIGGGQGSLL